MKVYVFGNPDISQDSVALNVAEKLKDSIDNIKFIFVKPNEDVPFVDESHAVIMDTVVGINEVTIMNGEAIDKLVLFPRASVHDFDLNFQLKYLYKLGKLGKVTIIGLPTNGKINYFVIQSILRKLVAQDIQGS